MSSALTKGAAARTSHGGPQPSVAGWWCTALPPAINDLYATRPPSTIVQPSQKVLTAAVAHEAYIVWWAKVSAFDAAHPDPRWGGPC